MKPASMTIDQYRQQKAKARPRRLPGTMNRTEQAYAEELYRRQLAGEIRDYRFEALTLKLAPDTRLTPDFFVVMADHTLELVDVKGMKRLPTGRETYYVTEDSRVKLKTAAQLFPWFVFKIAYRGSDGTWLHEEW